MADQNTLAFLAEEFALSFAPLVAAFESPGAYRDFVAEFGWDFDDVPSALDSLRAPVLEVWSMVDGRVVPNSEVADLLAAESTAFDAIAALGDDTSLPADFRGEFPGQLVDYLVVEHLIRSRPRWGFALLVLQLVRLEDHPASAGRLAFLRRKLAEDELGTFLTKPAEFLAQQYKWGQSDFEGVKLLSGIQQWLEALDLDVRSSLMADESFDHLNAGALNNQGLLRSAIQLLLFRTGNVPELSSGLGLYLLPETSSQKPGFALLPFTSLEFGQKFGVSLNLSAMLSASAEAAGALGLQVRPGDVEAFAGIDSGNPASFAGEVAVRIERSEAGDPVILLGVKEGTRLQVESGSLELGVRSLGNELEAFADFDLGVRISIAPAAGESDGFLAKLLPSTGVELPLDLSIGFSTVRGVQFGGSGGFEVRIPVNLQIGPLAVRSALVSVRFGDGDVPIELGVSAAATLGPVQVLLEDVGLASTFSFPSDKRGNLGFLDHRFSFKPPTGAGLMVDGGPVSGSGFLFFDRDAGRYFGAVELSVFGIGVQAFGLIETKLPSGEDGFSFVIVISAEFTPIQLGFGFTLIGVGGMLGVNRSMDAEGLSTAVRTGSLAHLLFPRNVVQDAPAIIHDLATVFPATPGQYIFGPMAKLGWGTPTLITCSIGIVLEFPGPRLAVLGIAQMALPTHDVDLLRLNLAMAGLLDFPAQKMTLDASLYDSKVVGNTVTGDMAYEMGFGNKPKFLMSVGGFNPGFESPPAFPDLRRASISLGINGNPSLTATGYFALTSNTAQAGARVELRAKGAGIKLSGHLGYDVLFVFSPFSFEAGISAGMSVRFHGFKISVTLRGDLSGPSPMRLKAKVCVSVKIWDACLKVNVKFGRDEKSYLPELDPWVGQEEHSDPAQVVIGMRTAVSDPRNWSGSAPPGAFTAVALTAASQAERTPIDPLGAATLRQKVAPLNRTLEKFGEYAPIVNDEFRVVDVKVDGESVDFSAVEDDFVPAHFTELSNAERLSGDSYEKMDAGVSIAPDLVRVGSAESLVMEYETKLINDAGLTIEGQPNFVLTKRHLLGMLKRSAAALSGTRRTGTQKYMHPTRAKKVRIVDEKYVIAEKCSLKQDLTKTGGVPVARTKAILALRKHLRQVPADKTRLSVIPSYEAVA